MDGLLSKWTLLGRDWGAESMPRLCVRERDRKGEKETEREREKEREERNKLVH